MEKDLRQIADMLLLNGTLTECPGLVHGKMGVAVFFFHYARHTGNELFADYAMELLGEMLNQLHVNSPADYEKGLAGIGFGMDYLISNAFLNVEDDICEDFDGRMVRAVMYDHWQDFSLYDGLTGYGRYWISRLRYQAPSVQARKCLWRMVEWIEERLPDISIKEHADVYCLLYDLQAMAGFERCIGLFERCRKNWDLASTDIGRCFPRLGASVIGRIIRLYQRKRYLINSLQDEMDAALKQLPEPDMEKAPVSTGLLNGYAGEGMLRLTALNQTDSSWMQLL